MYGVTCLLWLVIPGSFGGWTLDKTGTKPGYVEKEVSQTVSQQPLAKSLSGGAKIRGFDATS